MRTVRQILAQKSGSICSIGPDASVLDALALMAQKNIGALMVVEGGKLVGVLSERDYARKVILHGKSSSIDVREIMTKEVVTVSPSHTVDTCMAIMTGGRFRHLPVLDGADDDLIGVVSIGDLVKEIIDEQAQTIEHLQTYINS